ncbi:hypothetical protein B9N43_15525 [Denitratisoma sp. DHT3]|uniref:hypothetical protein n=1 Tax=Denitratisoma sp. DHT3 TaxID=1981880 RepID=UPI0011988D3A|nr:hypothetical protein [Denitratisoma sp. DHT3]QDX82519.1 hypothetical protein B9N43_15525 [Denitratisoma sp. DHT3]
MSLNPAADLAHRWWSRSAAVAAGGRPFAATAPEQVAEALAELCALALAENRRLLLVTPDDTLLADLSNALDLAIRPLCLVLPGADFVAPITLRASLALLKSRLTRCDEEDAFGAAWDEERARIARLADDWQQILDWCASNDNRAPWPPAVPHLFPVRVVPARRALAFHQGSADCLLLLGAEHLPPEVQALPASRVIRLSMPREGMVFGALVLTDETSRLRAELEALTRSIPDLELELATARAELAEFTHRYHDLIGTRMVELDHLQARIATELAARAPKSERARQEARQAEVRAQGSRREQARYEEAAGEAPRHFKPSGNLKKLFRQVAQKIHPDRAGSEEERHWRTRLMVEANRAYRDNDESGLREVLALWEEGRPDAAPEQTDSDSLARQVERLRRRLAEIQGELNRLFGSPLYELFLAARMARRQHRDLLQEMADNLDGQIRTARQRLDGLRAQAAGTDA